MNKFNYKELEACQNTSELKKTFRQLALQTHTDKGGNKDEFQDLHRKYKELLQLMEENSNNRLLEETTNIEFICCDYRNLGKAPTKMHRIRGRILYMLPLEVWMDILVFPWIGELPNWREENDKRKKLGPLVTDVGNRKFAEILQFYLHDFGKVQLGSMDISMLTTRSVEFCWFGCIKPHCVETFQFPQIMMPGNIKSFKRIEIRYISNQVFHFLHTLRPLFTSVYLRIAILRPTKKYMQRLRTTLANLLPMIRRIRALLLNEICLEFMQKHFPTHLARAKCVCLVGNPSLAISFDNISALLLQWLQSGAEWDEPRFCVFHFQLFWSGGNHFKQLIAAIIEPLSDKISSIKITFKNVTNFSNSSRQLRLGTEAKLGEWLKKEVNWHLDISMDNKDKVNANFKWLNSPSYSTFEHSYIDVNIWHA